MSKRDEVKRAIVKEQMMKPVYADISDRKLEAICGYIATGSVIRSVREELTAAGVLKGKASAVGRYKEGGKARGSGNRHSGTGDMIRGITPPSRGSAATIDPVGSPWADGSEPDYDRVYLIPVAAIAVDAERFQFKIGTGPSGVGGELAGVRVFNPALAGVVLVWRDPADRRTFIVNGHHRHDLATRLVYPVLAARYIRTDDDGEARAVGAMANIAEGRGTAVDAAKFIRDTGCPVEELERQGVSLKGRVAADGLALSRLSAKLFKLVVCGQLDMEMGVAVGRHLTNPKDQDEIFKAVEKDAKKRGRPASVAVVEEMAREAAELPRQTTETSTLFGVIGEDESLWVVRNELKAWVRAELSGEVKAFRFGASQNAAKRLAKKGNVLNVDVNRQVAAEAEALRSVFDRLANRSGAISATLTEYASVYAVAVTLKEQDRARGLCLDAVRRAIQSELDAAGNISQVQTTSTGTEAAAGVASAV